MPDVKTLGIIGYDSEEIIVYLRIRMLLLYLYSSLRGLINSRKDGKTVCLFFFGKIGDGVMFLDALEEYKRLYINEKGYRLVVGCRREVQLLLEQTGADRGIEFIEINRDKLYKSIGYFISRVRAFSREHPSLILHVRANSSVENVLIHAIPAARKIIFYSFPISVNNKFKRYYAEHTYTESYNAEMECDQLTNYAILLRKLGATHCKSRIPRIDLPKAHVEEMPEHYIVLSPGASLVHKCWPAERYAKVLDHYFENHCGAIVICGGTGDAGAADQIRTFMKKDVPMVNTAGKTSIIQWINIIKGAELVISNESASVHIAALCRVPCICIGEQTYGDMWLPYRPEIIVEGDCIPIVVRGEKLDCTFCAKCEFRKSPECAQCLAEHGIIQCVYEVTPEMVMLALDGISENL